MPWPKEVPAKRYPSDLTDEEWAIVEPLLKELDPYKTGRPREVDLREVLNAIFYLNKTGCPWRYLPKEFPDYRIVSYYYHRWVDKNVFEKINTAIHGQLPALLRWVSRLRLRQEAWPWIHEDGL